MNKTNPIGVRFRADLLEKLKKDHGIDSPQKALVFYERFYVSHADYAKDIKSPLRSLDNITQQPKPISLKATPKTAQDILEGKITTVTLDGAKPKNLEELKKLCPFPEKSDERSEWVRTERQKYGI